MTTGWAIAAIAVLIALVALFYLLYERKEGVLELQEESATSSASSLYTSSAYGFTLRHPSGFSVRESYRYLGFGEERGIHGVSFTIPAALREGSNLSADTYLSVERIAATTTCDAALFLPNLAASSTRISEAGAIYSVASTSEGAAGNRYDELVYALASSSPCTAVRYFIHSTAFENYPSGQVRRYDHAGLLRLFDSIRRSLTLLR